MAKRLRILTGQHSGAELHLDTGTYRIGASDDADIRIVDWRGLEAELTVDDNGVASIQRGPAQSNQEEPADSPPPSASLGAEADAPPANLAARPNQRPKILVDFEPEEFDDTVICVGPTDAVWPSDQNLFATLLNRTEEKPQAVESSREHKARDMLLRCSAVGAIVAIGSILVALIIGRPQFGSSAVSNEPAVLAHRVNEVLQSAHWLDLHADVRGTRVVVSGMVPTAADDAAVHTLLSRLSPDRILRRYDIAEADLSDIEESLDIPGLQVKYAGRAEFDITGAVADPRVVDERLNEVRHGLSQNIRQLRVAVTQSDDARPKLSGFSELVSSGTTRYAQTPDGVKHILSTFGDDGASAAAADAPDAASAASAVVPASEATAASTTARVSGLNGAVAASSTSDATEPKLPSDSTSAPGNTSDRGEHEARPARPSAPKPAYLPLPTR